MRVVFMGSPEFAIPTLTRLIQEHQVAAVVCQPDRPAGRGRRVQAPPVKQLAIKHGIPVLQPAKVRDADSLAAVRSRQPEIIVVAAYGQILPQALLDIPPHGSLNVHASLLPRWRGASPIQYALLTGDRETGVTIMRMDAGMDTGPLLAQRAIPIPEQVTAGDLSQSLAELGAELLADSIPAYVSGQLELVPQDDALATLAPRLTKSDGELDFNRGAYELARQVRAFEPWPGSFTHWSGRRLLIKAAHADRNGDGQPGSVHSLNGSPAVSTADGILVLDEVQLAGKTESSGADFLRGALGIVGAHLPN